MKHTLSDYVNAQISVENIEKLDALEAVEKIFEAYNYHTDLEAWNVCIDDIYGVICCCADFGRIDEVLNTEFLGRIRELLNDKDDAGPYTYNTIPRLLTEQLKTDELLEKFAALPDERLVIDPLMNLSSAHLLSETGKVVTDPKFIAMLKRHHPNATNKINKILNNLEFAKTNEALQKNFSQITHSQQSAKILECVKQSPEAKAVFESFIDLGKIVTNSMTFDDLYAALTKAQKTKALSAC